MALLQGAGWHCCGARHGAHRLPSCYLRVTRLPTPHGRSVEGHTVRRTATATGPEGRAASRVNRIASPGRRSAGPWSTATTGQAANTAVRHRGGTGSRTGEGGGPGARRGVPKIRSLRGDVIGGAPPETSGSAGNLA